MMILTDFVIESNRIEGIIGVEIEQREAHEWFLALERITIVHLEAFVDVPRLADFKSYTSESDVWLPVGGVDTEIA